MNAERLKKFYPYDWIIIGYSLLMVLVILILGRPLGAYADELIFYVSMAIIATIIASYTDLNGPRWSAVLRLVYPGLMMTFFYTMTGGLMFLVFDSFLDPQLTAFEHIIFGTNPTLYIDQHLLNPIANEIFSFCYGLYYPMLPVFLIAIIYRKDYKITVSFLAAASMTFILSYILFFLYPVEGPRWFFADQYLHLVESPFSRHFVDFIIDNGAVRGGCMPSSHFGVGMVILMYSLRYYRKVGLILLPIVIGLAIGTVWGRFHYVSDVIVGGLIGYGCTTFAWIYYDSRKEIMYNPVVTKAPEHKHAS